MAKAKVLLPEPDSPTIPTVSPFLILVDTFLRIEICLPVWLLNPIDKFLTLSIISFIYTGALVDRSIPNAFAKASAVKLIPIINELNPTIGAITDQ